MSRFATDIAHNQCPFCGFYFRQLSGHYGKSKLCKARADAYQISLINEPDPDPQLDAHQNTFGGAIDEEGGLPQDKFPVSPNSRPSKRARPTSPDVFIDSDPSSFSQPSIFSPQLNQNSISSFMNIDSPEPPEPEESTPFSAEKAFVLHPVYDYPRAGHIYKQDQPTIFDAMQKSTTTAYPYMPFMNEEEWSLAEFLATMLRVGSERRPESEVRRKVGVGLTEYTEEGNG